MSESLDEILSSESKGESRPRDESGRWVKSPAPETTSQQEPAPVVAAEAPPAAPPEPAPQAQAAEVPQPETPEAAPAPTPRAQKDPEAGLKAGIAAERERRQAAERIAEEVKAELAAIREQLQQRAAQPQQPMAPPVVPAQPPVDIWTDPDQYTKYQVSTELAPVRQQFENQIWELREELARTRYPDYDEARSYFLKTANENPAIREQFQRAPDPIKFAYESGKKFLAEEEARWMERLRPKFVAVSAPAPAAAPVPSSLNSEPSAGAPSFDFKAKPLDAFLPNKF